MGLFKRNSATVTPSPSTSSQQHSAAAVAISSEAPDPPAYDGQGSRTDKTTKLPAAPELYHFDDTPFTETVSFICPSAKPEYKASPAEVERVSRSRSVQVSLCVPKAEYNAASGKEATLDIFVYLEFPGGDLTAVVLEATYEPYLAPLPTTANDQSTSFITKKPWIVSASLAAALVNRDVELETKGRFTKTGVFTLRDTARSTSAYPATLGSKPQAICITSSYFGPCVVTFRVGVVHGKYAHWDVIRDPIHQEIQWQAGIRKAAATIGMARCC